MSKIKKISKIAISGRNLSGKDSLQQALTSILADRNIQSRRYSFGDFIKAEMKDFLLFCHGVDIFNCTPEEKEQVRPYIISYGEGRRKSTNGLAFIKQLFDDLYDIYSIVSSTGERISEAIPIITDLRFKEYAYDEVDFCKEDKGLIIYVSKTDAAGNEILPIIPVEIKNDPQLRAAADYHVKWPDKLDEFQRKQYLLDNHADMIEFIVQNA